jgi:ring-1,2-phenylacetyl-CoA epoxidase subunit PaaD
LVNALHSPDADGVIDEAPADKRQVRVTSSIARAWEVLESIPDPEIPVVSIRELGILREINERQDGGLEVVITPTYSGCPAMGQIEDDVRAALAANDIEASVVMRLAPAWTTDWITPAARERLREFGIAPPQPAQHSNVVLLSHRKPAAQAPCPHCGSANTTETSHFGSTACKALYKCLDCLEPFDYFKPY